MKLGESSRLEKWFFISMVVLTAGLYTVLISGLLEKKQGRKMMREEKNLTLTISQATTLIHDLQLERGLSIAFLYSRNPEFKEALVRQQAQADLGGAEADLRLGTGGYSMEAAGAVVFLRGVVSRMIRVGEIRSRVFALAITPEEVKTFYTGINTDLRAGFKRISQVMADKDTSSRMLSFLTFSTGKESAGQERALMIKMLSSGRDSPNLYRQISDLATRQTTYIEVFLSQAPDDVVREYERISAHRSFTDVRQMRETLLSGGGGISLQEWWKAATERINQLRKLEIFLLSGVKNRTGLAEIGAKESYYLYLIILVVTSVISLPLLILWGIGLLRGIQGSREGKDESVSLKAADKRRSQLIKTMVFMAAALLIIFLGQLGWSIYSSQKKGLTEKLIVQKEIIEAVGRFDAINSRADHAAGNVSATLSQILDAKNRAISQYRGSIEFTLAEKRGDRIVFLLIPGAAGTDIKALDSDRYKLGIIEYELPVMGRTATPMRLALEGGTGTVTGIDYQGVRVLAAHTPLQIGDRRFGLVAKIDMAEVFLPMVRTSLVILIVSGVLILTGAGRFLRLVNPLIGRLEKEVSANNAMIEASPCGIFTLDRKGKILEVNPTGEQFFGYGDREILGQAIQEIIPEYVSGTTDSIAGDRDTAGSRKDGSKFPLHATTGKMTVAGETRFVVMVSDMTELKAREDEVREHRDHLEELVALATAEIKAIVQTAVSGIITIDEEGIIHIFNPSAEVLFGWSKEELIGQNIAMLMEDTLGKKHTGYLKRFIKTRKASIIGTGREITAKRKDGSLFPAHLAVGHTELADGRHYFVGFVTDITDQKRREAELKQAKETAEAGARAKAAFVANMSHEIRTPMNAVIGFTEVALKDTGMAKETRGHLRTILSSGRSLLGIINDILDVSKMESGKFNLETICFHLPNTLAEALKTVASKAGEKGLDVALEYDPALGSLFTGDPTRLRQVILNLVGNSIKFTEKGGVTVSVREDSGVDMLRFAVRDTGIGMPPEHANKIFEPFVQADGSTTRKFGGTGLGTTISRQIVEMMGGQIWVESDEGEGSVFYFTARLPRAVSDAECLYIDQPESVEAYVSPRSFRVLLAEDVKANADLALLRLKEQGHQPEWVKNGVEAVAAFRDREFDLILMDVMMPEMDGLSATRSIREREKGQDRHTPILALTASVMQEEYNSCMAAGMDGVQAKPIDFDKLFAAMEGVVPEDWGIENVLAVQDRINKEEVDFSVLDGVADHGRALATWRDPRLYAGALTEFVRDHGEDGSLIRDLAGQGELKEAVRAVHTLKGLAGNLGLFRITEAAEKMETGFKTSGFSSADSLAGRLAFAISEAVDAVNQLDIPGDGPKKEPLKAFDSEVVARLIGELLSGLEQLDPDAAESVIETLSEYLPQTDIAPLREGVAGFDFDRAAEAARELIRKYKLEQGR
jgi:PAS domain S-box-containing protein